MKLKDIANMVGGELHGDGDLEISGVASLTSAAEGDITFADKNNLKYLGDTSAGAVIVPPDAPDDLSIPHIRCPNPYLAFTKVMRAFVPESLPPRGIHPSAVIDESAEVGEEASIGAQSFIGRNSTVGRGSTIFPLVYVGESVSIGENCVIYPNVTIYDKTIIGNSVVIHAGTVIGSDGFGYIPVGKKHHKIPQVGRVVVEDDVEIGANVTIDRATLDETRIGRGTKIDNLVQIAHNVTIGENCIILAEVGISGSTRIGNNVTLAGQVGTRDHIEIGDGSIVLGASVVADDIPPGSIYSSFWPAVPHNKWKRIFPLVREMPELVKAVRALQKEIEGMRGSR
ncbi:MAG: UDP-3-O-(3-hydroxymyristoyl)glucosamine N-acyltransferase [bacterium]